MIHLPFNITVERGRSNLIALGNLNNKEILIQCAHVYGDVVTRVAWANKEAISGGRDVFRYAQSCYLGEAVPELFEAVANPDVAGSQVVKICKGDEVIEAEDGITIPSGVFLVLNVEAPTQTQVSGTITWDVREANETL